MKKRSGVILTIACSVSIPIVMFGAILMGGSAEGAAVVGVILFLALVIGLLLFKLTEKGGYGVSADDRRKAFIKSILPDRTGQISKIIRQDDAEFSEVKFKAFAEYVYVTLAEEVCNQNISHVRIFLHDDFYRLVKKDMDARAINHIVAVMKNSDVSDVYLTSYSRDDRVERVSVCLYASSISYEINELNKQIISGDPRHRRSEGYMLDFVRNKGVRTSALNGELKTRNCPNCGAPVEDTGKCTYCGSVLTTGAYSWVLMAVHPVGDGVTDCGINIQGEQR